MTNATGFLLRMNLSDTGTLPRSSSDWTGCPDIIVPGPTAMSQNDIVADYAKATNSRLKEGVTNFFYIRAKNMNSAPLSQIAYMFQVPGSLVLHPEIWYSATNLIGYDARNPDGGDGTPDDPKIIQKYSQPLSAAAGQIVASQAWTWKPQTTEHHCMVAVVADTWKGILANYPGTGSMDALAHWIYMNPSFGWHNVDIDPVTSTVIEKVTGYTNGPTDAYVTFTIIGKNVPVGALMSFSANPGTSTGQTLGQLPIPVTAPPGGGTVNPNFQVGTALTVPAGYSTFITYRIDFNGQPVPANYGGISMQASVTSAPAQAQNSFVAMALESDDLERSFHRTHSPEVFFTDSTDNVYGQGLKGYLAAAAASPYGDDDDDDDIGNKVFILVGSHGSVPESS